LGREEEGAAARLFRPRFGPRFSPNPWGRGTVGPGPGRGGALVYGGGGALWAVELDPFDALALAVAR